MKVCVALLIVAFVVATALPVENKAEELNSLFDAEENGNADQTNELVREKRLIYVGFGGEILDGLRYDLLKN